jgi:Inorganic pyrophosphatase
VFPFDFGFVPGTHRADGDALDVLVLSDEPLFPLFFVQARLIGMIEAEQTQEGKTIRNDRMVAVAVGSRLYAKVKGAKQKKVFLGWMLLLPGCRPRRFPSLDRKGHHFVLQCARLNVEKLQQGRPVFTSRLTASIFLPSCSTKRVSSIFGSPGTLGREQKAAPERAMISAISHLVPLHVVRREKFWDRHGAIEGSKKAVRFSLVGPEGKVELGCFWRGGT